MLPVYSKCPANRCRGIHQASILPGRALFAAQTPQIMHSAQILPCMTAPAGRILLGESCRGRRTPLGESCYARQLPLGQPCRARWLLSSESRRPLWRLPLDKSRHTQRFSLDESRRAHQPPLDKCCCSRQLPLGESCRAIGPVARIPPRFAANDSVVILGSLHAGQDAPSPFQPLDPKTPKLKTLNPNHQGNTQSSSAFSHRRFEGWQPRFQWGRIQQLPLHQAPGAYRQAPTQEPSRE